MQNTARRILRQGLQPQETVQREESDDVSDQESVQDTVEESWRDQMIMWLDSSFYTHLWDCLDAFINIWFVTVYVLMTQFSIGTRGGRFPDPPPQYLQTMDCCIALLLLIQFLPRIYLSLDPWMRFKSMFSMTTFLSTISVLIVTWLCQVPDTFLEGGYFVFLYPFRFWRLNYALEHVFRPGKSLLFKMSPITQKGTLLGLSIFNTLITVTGWVHAILYMVQKYYDLTFFDVFYTIVVSSTSGLSTQIIPDNVFSRIVTLYVMVVGAIYIPSSLADLLQLIRSTSKYTKPYQKQKSKQHIVIVGNLQVSAIRGFLKEFFSDDHGALASSTQIVMINPQEPSEELQSLMRDPVYSDRTRYIRGSTMSFRVLAKAHLHSASAAFVLSTPDPERSNVEEDAVTALRKYSQSVKIYSQIIMPRNKIHLQGIADVVLCLDELKMAMLAQDCIAPGFSTLVYLLTTSIPKALSVFSKKLSSDMVQYLLGAEYEIYEIPVSEKYIGLSFSELSIRIYLHFASILIGICEEEEIQVNPVNHIFTGKEHLFLIAKSQSIANKIQKGLEECEWPVFSAEEISNRFKKPSVTELEDSSSLSSKIRAKSSTIIHLSQKRSRIQKQGSVEESVPGSTENINQQSEFLVSGHILICALGESFFSNAAYFLVPLRQKQSTPVVFLSQAPPEDFDYLKTLGNVYYIQGTSLLRKDLVKANVQLASKCIILGDPHQQTLDRSADAPVLLSLLNIQALVDIPFVKVEFAHTDNMKFIGNPFNLVEKQVSTEINDIGSFVLYPSFMSGQAILFNGGGKLPQLSKHPAPSLVSQETGHLQQITLQDQRFVGCPVRDFFVYLLHKHNCLMIALYRYPEEGDQQFVIVNPFDLLLQEDDAVFVFGPHLTTLD
ncbi:calcium-activated BK potassium channel alpha subunit-domain-containing protein [Gorgonomyces haynaldii]|nr:calcium-activated BK potassium channel alpha subunit-domain-containing protein [Gorgonomyces haynaldii]